MTKIYFGLTFATPVLPAPPADAAGETYLDYPGLLRYLEHFYALSRNPANREALRIEQYRQVIDLHRQGPTGAGSFYAEAFEADHVATAEDLLSRRDELLEAGYRLSVPATADTPERIAVLHQLESLLLDDENDFRLLPGLSDRLVSLLAALRDRRHPPLDVYVNEPTDLLPPGPRRLLEALAAAGDTVFPAHRNGSQASGSPSDLSQWQSKLGGLSEKKGKPDPLECRADGSLVVLRAERETHIAAYLARLARENTDWRPGVLMTVRNQTLDNALIMEGLPSMGIPSTSLARPSLQVLKLVTAFLWEPVEVARIMEFLSLVTKPLDRRLGQRLAEHLADTPGLFGSRWVYAVEQSFRDMKDKWGYSPPRIRKAREQYDFWFRRQRYGRELRVPKSEVRGLFAFLRNWALDAHEEDKAQTGLLVLSAQAERATELLDTRPETDLSYLDIERLVRTVYQPAPTQFQPAEMGALAVAFSPASTVSIPGSGQPELDRLVWWDFVETDPTYFFSRYYPAEEDYLRGRGCRVSRPEEGNRLRLWQNLQPLLTVRRQLFLCIPQRVEGAEVEPHALMGDLEAAFSSTDLARITVRIDDAGRPAELLGDLKLPDFAPVPLQPLAPPQPHIHITRPGALRPRERETPSSMDDLLFFPHKWVFRHQLGLRGTPILSIASENRLRGNLSHLFVEELLGEVAASDRPFILPDIDAWLAANAERLLRQQGAVLLEYGQEPERVQFLITMRKSIWTLVNYIQQNGWRIQGSEEEVLGRLTGGEEQEIRGRADLLLQRTTAAGVEETAVVDLKWTGSSTFKELMANARDIQLALYAELLRHSGKERVYTAYYILRDGVMLSRNELAFEGAQTVETKDDFLVVQREMVNKIIATYHWRWEQFSSGIVEVRCQETSPQLEDAYVDLPHDQLLEMREQTSRFDDYKSLIGLIR